MLSHFGAHLWLLRPVSRTLELAVIDTGGPAIEEWHVLDTESVQRGKGLGRESVSAIWLATNGLKARKGTVVRAVFS